MKIKFKIMLIVGLAVFAAFTATTIGIAKYSNDSMKQLAYRLAEEMVHQHSSIIQRKLEHTLEKTRGLELSFVELLKADIKDRGLIDKLLIEATKRDKEIFGAWTLWEPNAFDNQDALFANTVGHDETGRVNSYWHWNENDQMIEELNVNWETTDYYQRSKENKQGTLLDPHVRTVAKSSALVISATVPIIYQNQFLGVVSVDYKHTVLRREIAEINVLGTGYAALIANNGIFVAHFNDKYVGKNIKKSPVSSETLTAIQQGKRLVTLEYSQLLKTDVYRVYTPINVGETTSPWSLMIAIPVHVVLEPVSHLVRYIALLGAISIIAIGLILLATINHITRPLSNMVNTLELMVNKGFLMENFQTLTVTTTDEVGKLADTFNRLLRKLNTEFSERKKALHNLNQFKTTLDMTLDAIFMIDTETLKFVYVNQGFVSQIGYPEQELLTMQITAVKPLFTETQFRRMTTELLDGDALSKTYETVYRHKEGHLIPVEVYLQHIQVSSKQPEVYLVISRDISERKQIEKRLLESEANYRAIVEDQTELVCRFGIDGVLTFVNKAYCRYFDKTCGELIGHSFIPNIPPEDLQNIATAFLALCREHPVVTIQHRVILDDDSIRWQEWTNRMVLDDKNNFLEYLGVGRDITERKHAEIALQEAKEAAEVANQAKSTFLANMSHELRTPLNGVLGYAQILAREKSLTPKQQEGISIIQRSGEYLLTLINDVLDLSKIEAGKIELYLVDFDFNEFTRALTELFQMRAHQKGIAFNYKPLTQLPAGLKADEKRLRQVLINLLGNAVKFTDKGGVTLKIGYNNNKIRFQIEDTGVGIALNDIQHIFEPFQQVGDSTHKAEGTGLGLPITKRLIEMMGGELHVESILGQGSIFWTELALSESKVVKPKKEKTPTIIGHKGNPRKIFVIDDKKENRSVMVNLLTPLGFEVLEASNGREGIDIIENVKPDIILIDLVMPIMDGFEATRQIRVMPNFKHLPIIAASASVFDYHQQESKGAGCNDFMAKPFHVDELLALLQKHLQLEWLYDEEERAQIALEIVPAADEPFVAPSPEQATLLLDLAMMGDIAGIIETADRLEQENVQLTPFLKKIRQLAKNFAEEEICRLVELYVEKNAQ